jgi:Putative Ig domain
MTSAGKQLYAAAMLCLACAGMILLSACGGSSNQISITLNTPNGILMMDESQPAPAAPTTQTIIAAVGGDTANKGVTWSFLKQTGCSGSGLGIGSCGTLTNTTAFQVTYTAPAITATESVVITATSVADAGVTKTITLSIVLPAVFATTECNPAGVLPCTLPNGANAVPYSENFTFTGGVSPYTYTLLGSLPACLKLDTSTTSASGTIVGTPCGSGTATFTIQVTDSGGAPPVSQAFVITISPPPALTLTPTPLPPGTLDAPYAGSITTQGGVAPLTWTVTSGSLPPGLTLNSGTGQITGTPVDESHATPPVTYPATYTFFVQVHDSALPTPQTAPPSPAQFQITIQALQPLQIITQGPNLGGGMTATAYSANLNASGGVAPYNWTVIQGQLPAGLTLSSNPNGTATISGTPVLVGTSTFVVEVTDSETTPASSPPGTFTIAVTAGALNNTLFSGQYAFQFTGFDDGGGVQLIGTLTANGAGLITTGEVDANRVSGVGIGGIIVPQGGATPPGSTYTMGSDGRGTMELTMSFNGNAPIIADYRLVMDGEGNIKFFQDYTTKTTQDPEHTHGEGILKPVAGITFSGSSFSGNYAFLLPGFDLSNKPAALAGVVHSDGTTLTPPSGALNSDFNDNGTYSAQDISGSFEFISGNQATAALTFAPNNGAQVTVDFDVFFVTPSDLFFMEDDSSMATGLPTVFRLAGEAVLQSTGTQFGESALAGSSVASGTGVGSSGNASVFAGLLTSTACNNVAAVSLSYDENNGGTIDGGAAGPIAFSGTCAITSNGRVQFTGLGTSAGTTRVAAGYLTGLGSGFLIGSDAAVTTGRLEEQTITSFSAKSFWDGYTLSAPFIAENAVKNVIGQTTADGVSALSGAVDEIEASGATSPNLAQALTATFSDPAPSGRGTLATTGTAPSGSPANSIFYVVSPNSVRIVSATASDTHPELLLLDH